MCFNFLYNLCLKHFSFYEEMSEICWKMYIAFHVQYRLSLVDFSETSSLSKNFRKQIPIFIKFSKNSQIPIFMKFWKKSNTNFHEIFENSQIPIFMKTPPVGAELFHADR